jgi:hypothetical protein
MTPSEFVRFVQRDAGTAERRPREPVPRPTTQIQPWHQFSDSSTSPPVRSADICHDFGAFVGEWVNGQKKAASAFVKGDIRKAANDTISWGHIDDDIGYVNVYSLTGFTLDATWSNRAQQLAILDDASKRFSSRFATNMRSCWI